MANFADAARIALVVVAQERVVYASREAERLLGYGGRALVGRPVWTLIAPDEVPRVRRIRQARARGGPAPLHYESAALRRDGTRIWVDVRPSPAVWEGAPATLVIFSDITARKAAEHALQESEQRYRQLVEGSLQGIVVLRGGKVLMANGALARLFGMPRGRAIAPGTPFATLLAPHERPRFLAAHRRRLAGKRFPPQTEYEGRRKDGTAVWLLTMERQVDWEGRPAVLATVADITDRHRAEDELRSSQRLLSSVFDALPLLASIKDRRLRIRISNRELQRFHGLTAEQMAGHTSAGFPRRFKRNPALLRAERAALARRKPVRLPGIAVRRHDGAVRWFHIEKIPLLDERGRPTGVLSLNEDITARREAEAALRASERLLQTVFDAVPGRLFVTDRAGRYLRVNREQAQALGLPPAALVGRLNADLARRLGVPKAVVLEDERRVMRLGQRIETEGKPRRGRDGQSHWYHSIKVPLRDQAGRIAGQIALLTDVTAYKRAQEELRASQLLLETMFNTLPASIFIKDRAGRFVSVNRNTAESYGLKPEDMIGKDWHVLAPRLGGDERQAAAQDEEVIRTGARIEVPELPFRMHGEAELRWVRMIKVPLRDASGAIGGVVGMGIDVTGQHLAREALQAQQRLLRTVFDALPIRITVKDLEGRFLILNRAHNEAVGVAEQRYLGKTLREIPWVPAQRRKLYQEAEAEVLRTGRPVEIPELAMGKLGGRDTATVARMVKVPILDGQGRAEGIVTLWEDITARISADQELRRSRRLLQTVFDAIPMELTVKDAQLRYMMVNRAYQRHFTAPEAVLLGRTARQAGVLGAAVPAVTAADRQVLATRALLELPALEVRIGGRTRTHRILKVPLLDEGGGLEGLVTLSEDITERMRSERELRGSRLLLQTVFDIIPHYLFVRDPEGRYLMANRAVAALFGTTPDGLSGRKPAEFPGGAALTERWDEEDRTVIETGRPLDSGDYPFPGPGGTQVWQHSVKLPLRDDAGRIVGVVGLREDITARKQAELALQENQRVLEAAQRVGHIGSWSAVVGEAGSLRWSEEVFRIFAMSREEFDGRVDTVQGRIHPEDQERFRAALRGALKGSAEYNHEHRILRPGGEVRWVHERADILRDAQGRAQRMIGFVQDITERKQAELALAANERLLQAVLDAIPHNVFVKDRESRLVLVNRAHNRFWGTEGKRPDLAPEGFPGISPELSSAWRESDLAVMTAGQPLEREGDEVRNAGGKRAWLRWIKVPWRDEQGRIVGLVGLSEDITPRIEAEAALRAQQRLLQAVFDTIPQELFVKDAQGRFVLVNNAFARFYGLTPEQLRGLPHSELAGVPPALSAEWAAQDERVIQTGEAMEQQEYRVAAPDGHETWFELRKFPWRGERNQVIGVVGVREDITQRRHTEDLIRANRRLLRTVFDTIPHLLYVKDTRSRYIMVNQAMGDVYGQSPDTMAGTRTLDLPGSHEAQRADLLEADREVIETGLPVYRPEVPIHEEGRGDRWYNIIKLPLRDEEGKTIGIVGMSEDITERRRAGLDLQTNRRLLRAVFDAVPFWLMVRDPQGRATLANRRLAEDYGVASDDFLGKLMEDDPSLKPAEKETLTAMEAEVQRTHRPVGVPELALTLPRGQSRIMRMVVIPLFGPAGEQEGSLIQAEDITDRKRAEQALLQAQKLESLGVLAGGIAHDFNNLLVAVLGNASLALLKLKEGSAGRDELQQIEVAGQRAAELCRQMLAYAGKGPLEMLRVDLNALVREMAQLLKVSLPKGVAISFRLAENLPAIQGDPTQMRQVVMNLVINAGEAIGERQGIITLASGTQEVDREFLTRCQAALDVEPGQFVFLEVSDTGQGMTPETLARIFDPFFTTKFTGRGLGLASVLGIIRGHHGALRVYSEPGVGSAFRVLVPVAGRAAAAALEDAPPQPWAGGGTVLLVDDEPDIRAVTEKMLAYLGFTVVSAGSGQEALDTLRGLQVPLRAALVDLTMPGMAGTDLVRELRRGRDVPVLLMSGYNESDVQSRVLGRPHTEFLQKPFTLATLHAKLRALLGDPGAA